ncbi:putative chemotactic signal-response protein [Sulfitobacter noctilucae]|uniref:rod-binding protein n=1 Tax=Sulfitobacter noctilucae TaxID=1342302 RepID=UPI00046A9B64|nr:rod-binding protein [Sulfitobacter noctilucae]KIN65912.1 putative chemotactic signal-response protein [Sulfitobacter noctilucae]
MDPIRAVPAKSNMAIRDAPLLEAAEKLEASFLAEMLKAAGFGTSREEFGGGAGEDQFASFLVQEHAMAMVRAGGIGLSESIYEALKEQQDDRQDT